MNCILVLIVLTVYSVKAADERGGGYAPRSLGKTRAYSCLRFCKNCLYESRDGSITTGKRNFVRPLNILAGQSDNTVALKTEEKSRGRDVLSTQDITYFLKDHDLPEEIIYAWPAFSFTMIPGLDQQNSAHCGMYALYHLWCMKTGNDQQLVNRKLFRTMFTRWEKIILRYRAQNGHWNNLDEIELARRELQRTIAQQETVNLKSCAELLTDTEIKHLIEQDTSLQQLLDSDDVFIVPLNIALIAKYLQRENHFVADLATTIGLVNLEKRIRAQPAYLLVLTGMMHAHWVMCRVSCDLEGLRIEAIDSRCIGLFGNGNAALLASLCSPLKKKKVKKRSATTS